MPSELPVILVLGHSFVKRLHKDIEQRSHRQFSHDFELNFKANVCLHGVGGRTVPKLWKHDLSVVERISPDIIILEIGTNDLSDEEPLLVASSVEVLVRFLHDRFNVSVIGFCLVIPRGRLSNEVFNEKVSIFNELVRDLLKPLTYTFCWFHHGVSSKFLLRDGVHLNHAGQLRLYRSYRGAMLKALSFRP